MFCLFLSQFWVVFIYIISRFYLFVFSLNVISWLELKHCLSRLRLYLIVVVLCSWATLILGWYFCTCLLSQLIWSGARLLRDLCAAFSRLELLGCRLATGIKVLRCWAWALERGGKVRVPWHWLAACLHTWSTSFDRLRFTLSFLSKCFSWLHITARYSLFDNLKFTKNCRFSQHGRECISVAEIFSFWLIEQLLGHARVAYLLSLTHTHAADRLSLL